MQNELARVLIAALTLAQYVPHRWMAGTNQLETSAS
jgi:hypothetical protein